MEINKATNSTYRHLSNLFGKENADKLIEYAFYLDKHNVPSFRGFNVDFLGIDLEQLKKATVKKPKTFSQETLQKRYEKQLAKIKAKYGIE